MDRDDKNAERPEARAEDVEVPEYLQAAAAEFRRIMARRHPEYTWTVKIKSKDDFTS